MRIGNFFSADATTPNLWPHNKIFAKIWNFYNNKPSSFFFPTFHFLNPWLKHSRGHLLLFVPDPTTVFLFSLGERERSGKVVAIQLQIENCNMRIQLQAVAVAQGASWDKDSKVKVLQLQNEAPIPSVHTQCPWMHEQTRGGVNGQQRISIAWLHFQSDDIPQNLYFQDCHGQKPSQPPLVWIPL